MQSVFYQRWFLATIFGVMIVLLVTLNAIFGQNDGEDSIASSTPASTYTQTTMPTLTSTPSSLPSLTYTPTSTQTQIPTILPSLTYTSTNTPTLSQTPTLIPTPTDTVTPTQILAVETYTATHTGEGEELASIYTATIQPEDVVETAISTATVTPSTEPENTAEVIVANLSTDTVPSTPTISPTATPDFFVTESVEEPTNTADENVANADVATIETFITETIESTRTTEATSIPTGNPDIELIVPTEELQQFQVSGSIEGLPEETSLTIHLTGTGVSQTDVIRSHQYEYFLESGHYQITIMASYYLPVILEFDVYDSQLNLPPIQLIAGDFDGNRVIDRRDAHLLIHYYGQYVTDASMQMDLNGDGLINLLDLSILTSHFQMP